MLLVAVRRRRAEIAVLRALGLTPAQVRWTVATQAAVYAVAGLGLGIPLGIAAGRLLWRLVSEQTPFVYRPPLPALVLLLAVPITLLAVQVLALPVARLGVGRGLRKCSGRSDAAAAGEQERPPAPAIARQAQ